MYTIDELKDDNKEHENDIKELKDKIRMLNAENDAYRAQLAPGHSQTTPGITPKVLVTWINLNLELIHTFTERIHILMERIHFKKIMIKNQMKQITIAAYQGSTTAYTNFDCTRICCR